MDPLEPDEDFESIPWTTIAERPSPGGRPSWQPVLAGLAVGAVATFLALRIGSGSPVPATTSAPAVPAGPAVSEPVTSTSTSLLPEADLMAVDPPDLAAEAARLAEWFLTDFFTVDASGRAGAERWVPVPEAFSPEPVAVSTRVEGVEVLGVERVAPDRLRVEALVRRVMDGDPPVRDALGLEVEVAFTDDGGRIVDLPRPIPAPSEAVPDDVMAAGAAALSPLVGEDLLEGERTTAGWRLVFAARDGFGMVWPVAVTVPAEPAVPADQPK